jgi:CelD/BcsL family acetyltransferase involved in cellulose biosynthesis
MGHRLISEPVHGQVETVVEIGPELETEWDELAERSRAGPFLRPGWFRAWAECFGEGRARFVALRRGGSLMAVAPLMYEGRRASSATNAESPEFEFLFADVGALNELCESVLASRPSRLSLIRLNQSNETAQAARASAGAAGYRVTGRAVQRSPYLDIQGSWEEFEQSLSRNLRQSMRRKRRKLDQQGRVEIGIHDGSEGLDDLLEEGFGVESSGWKARGGTAIQSDPRLLRFYTEVARWAARKGWLRLCFLRLDGRPVAFRFDLELEKAIFHVKGGFDPGFAQVSPGNVLTAAVLENAFGRGLARHEFLGAAERHKLLWTQTCHERLRLDAFAPTLAGRLGWSFEARAKPLARRLRGRARRRSADA